MNRKSLFATAAFLLAVFPIISGGEASVSPGPEITQWKMTLRVLEGIKEGAAEPATAVTSSYLKHTLTASIASGPDLAEERNQIRKIFNLKDVRLLTEADLSWSRAGAAKASHAFRLDGQEYSVSIAAGIASGRQPFRIQVQERNGGGPTSLLDTGFGLPDNSKSFVVFGFENTRGTPYFLSLHAILVKPETRPDQDPALKARRAEFAAGAFVVPQDGKAPKLIMQVDPVYPEEARQKGIQGVVILEGKIDETGRVVDTMVLKSVPELDKAAVDALRRWVYEPMKIGGKAVKVVFTVTVRFVLDKNKGEARQGSEEGLMDPEFEKKLKAFEAGAVPCKDDIMPPRLLKQVDPLYPEEARSRKIEGVVILSLKTDESGKVIDAMVLRSIAGLDQAALDAAKQWVYEPLRLDGKVVKAIFTVTVRFKLN